MAEDKRKNCRYSHGCHFMRILVKFTNKMGGILIPLFLPLGYTPGLKYESYFRENCRSAVLSKLEKYPIPELSVRIGDNGIISTKDANFVNMDIQSFYIKSAFMWYKKINYKEDSHYCR